jgi:hypothetical protein
MTAPAIPLDLGHEPPFAYALVVDDALMGLWLAAHGEMARHWEEAHPTGANAPCRACMPLLREEALRFARVERMAADGLVTALEGL